MRRLLRLYLFACLLLTAAITAKTGLAEMFAFVPSEVISAFHNQNAPLLFTRAGRSVFDSDTLHAADSIMLTLDDKRVWIAVEYQDSFVSNRYALTIQVENAILDLLPIASASDCPSPSITFRIYELSSRGPELSCLGVDTAGRILQRHVQIEPLTASGRELGIAFKIHGIPFYAHFLSLAKNANYLGSPENIPKALIMPGLRIDFAGATSDRRPLIDNFRVRRIQFNDAIKPEPDPEHVYRTFSPSLVHMLKKSESELPNYVATNVSLADQDRSIVIKDPDDANALPLIIKEYLVGYHHFLELRSGRRTVQIALTSARQPNREIKLFENHSFSPTHTIRNLICQDDLDDLVDFGTHFTCLANNHFVFDGWDVEIFTNLGAGREAPHWVDFLRIFPTSRAAKGIDVYFLSDRTNNFGTPQPLGIGSIYRFTND